MARQGRAKRHVESNMCHAAGTWHLSAHAAMSEALDALLDLRRGRPDTPMLPGLASPRGPLANFSIRMIRPWLSGACVQPRGNPACLLPTAGACRVCRSACS